MPEFILTADPGFVDLALVEVRRDGAAVEEVAELAPGVLLLASPGGFWPLAETWLAAPPIFPRHIHPVDATLPLSATPTDLENLAGLVADELAPLVDPELPFSVQTRLFSADLPFKPYDVNTALARVIQEATSAPLNVPNPVQVLSVVCADRFDAPTAFLGLSPAAYNLSDWAGGVRRFARETGQISRAEFKLLEALEVFDIDLPPRGVALDLGAAPGGWTRVLRQREQYVTAVDPAELDPRLQGEPGVRHLAMTAEAYLENEPDPFDLILNDMRMDARDSARLMVRYAPYLYPHGSVLMTFKLPENGREEVLEGAFAILSRVYRVAGARQLFHNRSELTVYLRKRNP